MAYEPPFLETYKTLVQQHLGDSRNEFIVERCDIPLIDLGRLSLEREECMREIAEAAREWGFFQVVNHGISHELLKSLQIEQKKVFYQPFLNKSSTQGKAYRWGNPFATNLRQLSWSEAFHFYLTDISRMDQHETLRYPQCPISSKVHGLLPHSDTSFLTIVHQDQVGGLQLLKDGKWVGVKPNPHALVVNIGDLFQALSNGVYKSIKHRVVAAEKVERFSMAFFYSPSEEAIIQSQIKPPIYRKFTLREYRQQTEKDVKQTGDKVGLSRFLL
ncbi:Gibberellin 2-beta-dioxygenase 8 [Glycine soja]|nr:Gibberellin 2-beta-dioxygenase 8 [Glycine soja]